MDSYAGKEPREFIPFHLGKEPNGQPNQTVTENNNPSSSTGITKDVATNETPGQEVEKSLDAPIPQTSDQQPLVRELPTAIEIIEEGSSQASGTQGTKSRLSPATLTEIDTRSQGLQSPDYSPSLLNLLGTDGSSSEESIQTYLTRKLDARTEEVKELGPSGGQTKCSVSDPIQLSSSPNLPPETKGLELSESPVTVPASSTGTTRQSETNVPIGSAERPRIGSSTTVDVQPPLNFGLLSSYLINADPISVQPDRKNRTTLSDQLEAPVVRRSNLRQTLSPLATLLDPSSPRP